LRSRVGLRLRYGLFVPVWLRLRYHTVAVGLRSGWTFHVRRLDALLRLLVYSFVDSFGC